MNYLTKSEKKRMKSEELNIKSPIQNLLSQSQRKHLRNSKISLTIIGINVGKLMYQKLQKKIMVTDIIHQDQAIKAM